MDWFRILSIAIQIAALGVPILCVYSEEKREVNMNLIKHGFLSMAVLIIYVVLFFTTMLQPFRSMVSLSFAFGHLIFPLMWVHSIVGVASIVLGSIIVVAWFTEPLADLGCSKVWKLMIPTIIVWSISVVLGVVEFFLGWM